ncbi:MAG: acetyl-CoA carboxylase biotin carboxylase subunit [Deltaproteobacteria bacterium]|jgi:acetyl-CoA carboxylase, biotin carboxylase subunit|nr:acetyl-CoA carboxylase biotin carboxylase subunit [Deltaproteobacteria bacterium]
MKNITRVLVANRGEIAVRIIRACRELGIETILAVSEADRESLPAKLADRAVCIGPPAPMQSYLKIETIVAAALGSGSDAIHPGYGFLAEQPKLALMCAAHGLVFVGPKANDIERMGDKLYARKLVEGLGISIIPGSALVSNLGEAVEAAEKVGYPVLLKAAAGGGGKGMKIVEKTEDLRTVFDEASVEALSAFGDDRIYVEHYIPNARHIEVQIIGDRFGNVVHLFERDCSIQRRYQKMVEEAPSPAVSPELREAFCEAAVRIAKQIGYENAGTVEFLLDQDHGRFYFLEMNTRIQVEHPVTEMISGIDLVKEQFRVASGNSISFAQEEVTLTGHAIECRINAESPTAGFAPCPGRIRKWNAPEREGVRIDSHCYSGYFVPPYYDSLLAKLITWGRDRDQAIGSMQEALMDFTVSGIDTTIPFHRFIMKNPDYRNGNISTGWIENSLLKEYERDEGNQFC